LTAKALPDDGRAPAGSRPHDYKSFAVDIRPNPLGLPECGACEDQTNKNIQGFSREGKALYAIGGKEAQGFSREGKAL
jgi:hypothetical protein